MAEPPLLVLGDSFAHGDEVSDAEAWPALLQRAGSPSPGDQRRHERLRHRPDGPARDDGGARREARSDRAELHRRRCPAHGDEARVGCREALLHVDGQHAGRAQHPRAAAARSGHHARFLGHPARPLGAVRDRPEVARAWWDEWTADHVRVPCRTATASPSFARCSRRPRRGSAVPVLVVAEYAPYHWQNERYARTTRATTRAVLKCAETAGFSTLDLFDTIDAAVRERGLWMRSSAKPIRARSAPRSRPRRSPPSCATPPSAWRAP